MQDKRAFWPAALTAATMAAVAATALLVSSDSGVRAQTPPAPCACSRVTPIFGADEVSAGTGQMLPRFGLVHCQCGTATCVSQISYASVGSPQLFCVRAER